MADNTLSRSLHDLGLAGWFGGTLMGATAANRAAADLDDDRAAGKVVNEIWRRWWLVNLACIAAHSIGGLGVAAANRRRIGAQSGVGTASAVKTALTVAAAGVSTYSGYLGKQISDAGDVPMEDGTTPTDATPSPVASALKRQAALQWVVPVLTGAIIVASAKHGEQQRPSQVAAGVIDRLNPRG